MVDFKFLSEDWTIFDWRRFRREFYDGDYYKDRVNKSFKIDFEEKRAREMIRYNKTYGK